VIDCKDGRTGKLENMLVSFYMFRCQVKYLPEDDWNTDRNMSVGTLWIQYIIEYQSAFCCLFIYFWMLVFQLVVSPFRTKPFRPPLTVSLVRKWTA